MTEDRPNFLRKRLKQAAEADPTILELREKLLSIGGIEFVPPATVDPDVKELVQSGSVVHGTPQLHEMDASACHENVAKLWDREPRLLHYIGTGYALTSDGLWRQHSWGVTPDGTIVETTALRLVYFGLLLEGDKADRFVFCNSGD
jgi:hypothetical protein